MGLGMWYRINMSPNNKGKWCTRHRMNRVSVLKTLYCRCRAVFVVSFLGEGEWMCLGNKVTDGGQLYRVTLHQELVDMERKYLHLWNPPEIKIRVWRNISTTPPTHWGPADGAGYWSPTYLIVWEELWIEVGVWEPDYVGDAPERPSCWRWPLRLVGNHHTECLSLPCSALSAISINAKCKWVI